MNDEHFWRQLDYFLLQLHRSLRLSDVLAVAVNDGRSLIGCDRLSVILKVGIRAEVRAVSGLEQVNSKSLLVRLLARLGREIIRTGGPLNYSGAVEDYLPPVEEALVEYLQESQSRMILIWPLRGNLAIPREVDPEIFFKQKQTNSPIVGCLVVEQSLESVPRPGVRERSELIAHHVGGAVQNAQRHESIFLLPILVSVGSLLGWFRGRRLVAATAVIALFIAFISACVFVPYDYRVEATGMLMPAQRQEIFAPVNGDVVEIFVEDGQWVSPEEPLVRLKSDELQTEYVTAYTENEERRKQVIALDSQLREVERKGTKEEMLRVQGELKRAEIELVGAAEKLKLLQGRIDRLIVRSPARGVVAMFRIREQLLYRPVQRGERLLEVADPNGPWQLELDVQEYRVGHILRYLQTATKPLPVKYVLATAVETTHQAHFARIATRSDESEKLGSVVSLIADLDLDNSPEMHLGAEVIAKIYCGKCSLGYVLFGDVIEFFERHVLF